MFDKNNTDENAKKFVESAFERDETEIPAELLPENIEKLIDGISPKRVIRWKRYAALAAALVVCTVSAAVMLHILPHGDLVPSDIATHYTDSYDELYSKLETAISVNTGSAVVSGSGGPGAATGVPNIGVKEETTGTVFNDTAAPGEGKHSETNVQVENVDEADILKTDGRYLYAAYKNKIKVIDSSDMLVSEIKLGKNRYVQEMFLNGGKLTVISARTNSYGYRGGEILVDDIAWGAPTEAFVYVDVYDVTNPKQPKLVFSYEQDGDYRSSRMTDGCLYLVTEDWLETERINKKKISTYVPYVTVQEKRHYVPPEKIICSKYFNYNISVTMTSAVDLKSDDPVIDTAAYYGAVDEVYATSESLYLLSFDYISDPDITHIYRYTIANGKIEFAAKGEAEGRMLNQFSADEHDGYFRIATTYSRTVKIKGYDRVVFANAVTVFDLNLKQVGKLDNIAPEESIFAARFMGDIAYLVTFEQTDPLFTISLKNPKQPKILGELKIPGFSNYLHPIGDGLMLGVGKEDKALKLSLFDVTDLTRPKELDKYLFGEGGYYVNSPAEYDHKAFTEFDGKYYIPAVSYGSEVKCCILEISVKNGKLKITEISSDEDIQRTAVIDDRLYALYYKGLEAYDINTHKQIKKIKF